MPSCGCVIACTNARCQVLLLSVVSLSAVSRGAWLWGIGPRYLYSVSSCVDDARGPGFYGFVFSSLQEGGTPKTVRGAI